MTDIEITTEEIARVELGGGEQNSLTITVHHTTITGLFDDFFMGPWNHGDDGYGDRDQ